MENNQVSAPMSREAFLFPSRFPKIDRRKRDTELDDNPKSRGSDKRDDNVETVRSINHRSCLLVAQWQSRIP